MKKDTHTKNQGRKKQKKKKNDHQREMDADSIDTNGNLHCDKQQSVADLEFKLVRFWISTLPYLALLILFRPCGP